MFNGLAVPALAVANATTGVPERTTTSAPSTPTKEPVPINVVAVVPSYTLFVPDNPVTVKAFGVILALNPEGCALIV